MWLRLWPLAYSGPDCRGGRRISISVIALCHGEEVWGKSTFFFPGDKDIFSGIFQRFLFPLWFDPLATTLLRSYQWHKRVARLRGNNLNREAGNLQPEPVACVSRLTGLHPSESDTGGGGLCLFCRWWIEEEGIIDNSSSPVRTGAGTILL